MSHFGVKIHPQSLAMSRNRLFSLGGAKSLLERCRCPKIARAAANLGLRQLLDTFSSHSSLRVSARPRPKSVADSLHNVVELLSTGPFVNAKDAPAFRFRGDKYSHCYGAPSRAEKNTAAGKAVFFAVLGVFVVCLFGSPVWFILFYNEHKAKYEKLARGDEDL